MGKQQQKNIEVGKSVALWEAPVRFFSSTAAHLGTSLLHVSLLQEASC